MRLSAARRTASKSAASSDASGSFSPVNERTLLTNILSSPKRPATYDFVKIRDEVAAQQNRRNNVHVHRRRVQQLLKSQADLPEPTAAARELMSRPAVTTKNIENFLISNYLDGIPRFERPERIHAGILDLLSASSANNLRSLMQFLALYWQIGIADTRPSIFHARNQARLLSLKGMELHPETRFQNGGEQVGIPDFGKFTQFVVNFFKYMNVPSSATDELYDSLSRLQVRSGSLREATTEVSALRENVNPETLQMFLNTLGRSDPNETVLQSVRPSLLREDLGPAAVQFLVPLISQQDLLHLVELIDQSCWRDEIYDVCQSDLVQAVLNKAESPVSGLAQMFGSLQRIKKHAPIAQATIDVGIKAAQGNESAITMLKALKD